MLLIPMHCPRQRYGVEGFLARMFLSPVVTRVRGYKELDPDYFSDLLN